MSIHLAVVGSVAARLMADLAPQKATLVCGLPALFRVLAFAAFAVLCGPLLVKRKPGYG